MKTAEMDDLVEAHITAESAGDTAVAVAHNYYGKDFRVTEHLATGTVTGDFLGVPGEGKRVTFRLLHVWEFRDGLISRENVWLDGASVIAQLTAAEANQS